MTFYTALKIVDKYKLNLSKIYFKISNSATEISGTKAYLLSQSWINLNDLFYALMLPSGNDAAIIIAEYLGAFLYLRSEYDIKNLTELIYNRKKFRNEML